MTAANRYAQALFSLAQENGQQSAVAAAVSALAEAVADTSVTAALANPRLTPAQRTQLAQSMAKATKAPSTLTNTLGVLAANNRLAVLPQVLAAYTTLHAKASGTTHVKLASASALTEAQRTKLTALIKDYTKSTAVQLEETVEPSLQAGFRAYFNGQVWDASLSGAVSRLATSLRAAVKQSHKA